MPNASTAAPLADTPEARRRFHAEREDAAFKAAHAAALEEQRLAAEARAAAAHRIELETELATANATLQEAPAAYQPAIDMVRGAVGQLVAALVALAAIERNLAVTGQRAKEIAIELGDPSRAIVHSHLGAQLSANAAAALLSAAEEQTEALVRGCKVEDLRVEKQRIYTVHGFDLRVKLRELAALGGR